MLSDFRVFETPSKILAGIVSSPDPHHRKFFRKAPLFCQVRKGRKDFPRREVSRSAEDHNRQRALFVARRGSKNRAGQEGKNKDNFVEHAVVAWSTRELKER